MKHYSFIILIGLIPFFIHGQADKKTDEKRKAVNEIWDAIKNNDAARFKLLVCSKSSLIEIIQTTDNIERLDSIKTQALNEELETLTNDYYRESAEDFRKIHIRGKELNVKWSIARLDSVKWDSTIAYNRTVYSAILFFENTDGSNYFKLNISGLAKYLDGYHVEKVFTPYIHIGPRNRALMANIKQAYINDCIKQAKLAIAKNPQLESMFFYPKIETFCECK